MIKIIQYNAGQIECIERVSIFYRNWYKGLRIGPHPQYYSYSGPAGSGKTTVLRAIISELNLKVNEYICCALSGKATLEIIKRGLPAQTFHSLIYNPNIVKVLTPEYYDKISGKMKDYYYKHIFEKNHKLPGHIKVIFVDEATMINDNMRDDLLSFGIPVVFIGDQNQLPPVQGKSSVMDEPDYILTEVMRQHEDSPIIQLAHMILNDQYIGHGTYGDCRVMEEVPYNDCLINDYDIVLTCKNKTRDHINSFIREDIYGRSTDKIYLGDKVINRHNERDYFIDNIWLTNGTIGRVSAINSSRHLGKPYVNIDFKPDFMDESFEELMISNKYLTADALSRSRHMKDKYMLFEYAYAITVHLSQGSEFDRVLYIDEPFHPSVVKSLRYTAITRAKGIIDIVTPRGMWSPKNY